MFTHLGMIDLGETSRSEVEGIATALSGLVGAIPGLASVETFVDAGLGGERNASLAFVARFDDERAWRSYSKHPEHVEIVSNRIGPVLTRALFVQASVPGPGATR